MHIKVRGSDVKLDVVSFVNGVLIGIDESAVDRESDDESENDNKSASKPRKRLKKDPEDNLGEVIGFLDTDRIDRGVDFLTIKYEIDGLKKDKGWTLSDIFKKDEVLADICSRYDYTLQNLIKLMMEHMPDEVDLAFLRSTVKPAITALQKMKAAYAIQSTSAAEKGGVADDAVEYRRIFDFL